MFSVNELLGFICLLFFVILLLWGEVQYLKGKLQIIIKEDHQTDGWQDEALYWRELFQQQQLAANILAKKDSSNEEEHF